MCWGPEYGDTPLLVGPKTFSHRFSKKSVSLKVQRWRLTIEELWGPAAARVLGKHAFLPNRFFDRRFRRLLPIKCCMYRFDHPPCSLHLFMGGRPLRLFPWIFPTYVGKGPTMAYTPMRGVLRLVEILTLARRPILLNLGLGQFLSILFEATRLSSMESQQIFPLLRRHARFSPSLCQMFSVSGSNLHGRPGWVDSTTLYYQSLWA